MHPVNIGLLTIITCLFSFKSYGSEALMVHDAWVPEMPPVSRVHAGFASFHNMSGKTIEIQSFSSPQYTRIEMHLSKEVDGMARMIPQKSLVVQANQMLTLKHGSYHLMMFQPKQKLKSGDSVELTMLLSDGQQQNFTATVRKSGQDTSHQHHHH